MSVFPNVPNLPGVPPLLRSGLNTAATVQGVLAGVANTLQFLGGRPPLPSWGIYDSNFRSVVDADSFLAFGNQNNANLPDFPVQQGGFGTYNKVILPAATFVRISKGGTLNDRRNLLEQVKTLFKSMGLYTIVTPEQTFLSANMERYEVTRRDKNAAFLLTDVDLFFREVQPVTAVFTNTPTAADTSNAKNPSALGPVNQGVIQPVTPSAAAQNAANTALANAGVLG